LHSAFTLFGGNGQLVDLRLELKQELQEIQGLRVFHDFGNSFLVVLKSLFMLSASPLYLDFFLRAFLFGFLGLLEDLRELFFVEISVQRELLKGRVF